MKKTSSLSIISVVLGTFAVFTSLLFYWSLIPKVNSMYSDFELSSSLLILQNIFLLIIALMGATNVMWGVLGLKNPLKFKISVPFLVFSNVFILVLFFSFTYLFITSIYRLTSTF